ncbi:hypothetical protein [Winogradskyella sp.]
MFGYKEFSDDVLSVFDSQFLNNYNLVQSNFDSSSVTFESDKCILIIDVDGLVLDGYFIEPNTSLEDNKFYSLSSFFELKDFGYEALTIIHQNRENIIFRLKELKRYLESYGDEILIKGDFSIFNRG